MNPPYPVRFAHALAARWKPLALSAFWLCAGVAACLTMWARHGDPFLAAQLERTGHITQGPVVDIEKLARPDGTPEWRITYEFLDVPGAKFRGSIRVPTQDAVGPYEKAGNVTVRYLRSDPRVNAVVGQKLTTMTEETGQALILGTAAGVLPLLYALIAAALTARRAASSSP